MMQSTEFRLTRSTTRRCGIVEVWHLGKFIASIYPTDKGFRVVISSHVSDPLPSVLMMDDSATWDFEAKEL